MASLGQYQSFALIAYSALQKQGSTMACCRNKGQNVTDTAMLLYLANKQADIVFSYSIGTMSYDQVTENDIISICDWLMTNLLFSVGPITSLASTTLNNVSGPPLPPPTILYDFNQLDFKPLDFA